MRNITENMFLAHSLSFSLIHLTIPVIFQLLTPIAMPSKAKSLSRRKKDDRMSPDDAHHYIPALMSLAVHVILPFIRCDLLGISAADQRRSDHFKSSSADLLCLDRPLHSEHYSHQLLSGQVVSTDHSRYRILLTQLSVLYDCADPSLLSRLDYQSPASSRSDWYHFGHDLLGINPVS